MKIDVIYRDELQKLDERFLQLPNQIAGAFRVEDVVEGRTLIAVLPSVRKHLDAYMDDPDNKHVRELIEQLADQAFQEIMNRTEE